MTEYEKMLAGQWYNPLDLELRQLRQQSRERCARYNNTGAGHHKQRRLLLAELFASVGQNLFIEPPFFCDYGKHIQFGDNVFLNVNCVLLDVAAIRIGNNVFFGPNVQLYTVNHPLDAATRRTGIERAAPINIGDDVWLGGGVIVCPGITIGDRVVVAAGAVVTQNLAADGLYAGNHAKWIKALNN